MGCYPHFILPVRRSRGFASTAAHWSALFGLAFASAPAQSALTSRTTVSRRIIMQKARRHPVLTDVGLRPLVGVWFQVHCPPLVGVLPIVRSRYWVSLSVAKEYLALRDGPRGFEPAFTCPALLRDSTGDPLPTRTGLSPSTVELSRSLPLEGDLVTPMCRPYNPPRTSPGGLGFSAFARRY
jgi:hypothetical protein